MSKPRDFISMREGISLIFSIGEEDLIEMQGDLEDYEDIYPEDLEIEYAHELKEIILDNYDTAYEDILKIHKRIIRDQDYYSSEQLKRLKAAINAYLSFFRKLKDDGVKYADAVIKQYKKRPLNRTQLAASIKKLYKFIMSILDGKKNKEFKKQYRSKTKKK